MTSNIYNLLVEDDEDLIGMIAYSLYKQHKIEFLKATINKSGRKPNEAELESFYFSASAQSQLDKYKNEAEDLLYCISLQNMEDEFKSSQLSDLKDYTDSIDSKVEAKIKEATPSLLRDVFSNVLSTIVCSIIIISFLLIGAFSQNRLFNAIGEFAKNVMGVEQEYKQHTQVSEIFDVEGCETPQD